MRRYCIVSGILLILPIIDLAITAPVSTNVVHVPEDAITMLGKRVNELEELNVYIINEGHFALPEASSATRPESSSPQSGSDRGQMNVKQSPSSSKESPEPPRPGLPSIPPADYEMVGEHAPLSSPVIPSWFTTDRGYWGPHAPMANSDDRLVVEEPPAQLAADHGYDMVHPPPSSKPSVKSPGSASLTEPAGNADYGYEMAHRPDVPPSSPVPSKNPSRRSIGADSGVEYLQAIRDASKSKANRVYGTAGDVLNA